MTCILSQSTPPSSPNIVNLSYHSVLSERFAPFICSPLYYIHFTCLTLPYSLEQFPTPHLQCTTLHSESLLTLTSTTFTYKNSIKLKLSQLSFQEQGSPLIFVQTNLSFLRFCLYVEKNSFTFLCSLTKLLLLDGT